MMNMKRRSVLAALGSTLLMLLGVRPRSSRPTGAALFAIDATTRGTGKTRLVQATASSANADAQCWSNIPLRGVITTPTFCSDGTILRGCDSKTGMLYIPGASRET
jgi:hypothetical protein